MGRISTVKIPRSVLYFADAVLTAFIVEGVLKIELTPKAREQIPLL